MTPSKDQALSFAIMLKAGLPPSDAVRFFSESDDPQELAALMNAFLRSRALAQAQKELLGKSWQEMSLDEQVATAIDYAHAGMAYFLFSTNYSQMGQSDQAKFNAARTALEARIAGTLGKSDPLSRFLEEFTAKKKVENGTK